MRVRIIILVSIFTHAIRARVYRDPKSKHQKTKNAKPQKNKNTKPKKLNQTITKRHR